MVRGSFIHTTDEAPFNSASSHSPSLFQTRLADAETLTLGFGDVTVSKTTFAFKTVKVGSLDSIGWGKLDLPWHHREARAFWLSPTEETVSRLIAAAHKLPEAMAGLKNLFLAALPFFAMCDRSDLGVVVDASNLGQAALFIYDRFHGGLGYSRVGFDEMERLLAACLDILASCLCEEGCPACVELPSVTLDRHEDPDLSPKFAIPGKAAARAAVFVTGDESVIVRRCQPHLAGLS